MIKEIYLFVTFTAVCLLCGVLAGLTTAGVFYIIVELNPINLIYPIITGGTGYLIFKLYRNTLNE